MTDQPAAPAPVLLKDALVLDYLPVAMDADPAPRVERCDLLLRDGRVAERGRDLSAPAGGGVKQLDGSVVMPGHVNGHHHLYSVLAPGMPAPANTPRSFQDVLTEIWWKLDRALDDEAIYYSAVAGSWDALRCGTTLIFDHHSSLTRVGGSLDHIEKGMSDAGVRGCLCYEVTDRGGPGARDMTLEENRRYLTKLRENGDEPIPRFRGMAGAHASFTLEDRALERLGEVCDEFDVGIHIHLCEGTTDREVCRERGWNDPVARLDAHGLLRRGSLLAHGVDLKPEELRLIDERGAWMVHNGRSNMNNSVGRAPVDRFPSRSCFGTDGLDGNMWGEMRTTFFRGNETGRGQLGFSGALNMWLGGYRLAREVFGEPFGSLDVGAPADFLVCNAGHKSPLSEDNWLSLMLFGFHPWDVREVWVGADQKYSYGDTSPYDGVACRAAAKRIWDGMATL